MSSRPVRDPVGGRKTCLSCGWDYSVDYFIERPKGKPPMCKSCSKKAQERKRKSS